ncbi:MAG: dephospho-CoA kinase, partial [Clostridia bacterium]|nr:dephospho-CoA kinase [Clostridia bacterium]
MTQNNIKIAVTGGICSGKSTVANFIKEQGYSVISCDEIYNELLTDLNFVNLLDNEFGNIKNSDGTLNRSKLSEIVFNDSEKLQKLNLLTHPQIMREAFARMSGEGIFFCEVPLLFEGGFERLFDNVIVVLREKDNRLKALIERNRINENQAKLRINSQFEYKNGDLVKYYVI